MTALAICFYTPESYDELKKVAVDKKSLCDTYADWMIEFQKAVTGLKEQGYSPITVTVNISELQNWCKENKLENKGSSRAKYASIIAQKLNPDF